MDHTAFPQSERGGQTGACQMVGDRKSLSSTIDLVLAAILDDANRFVRRLGLASHQQHLRDDIVQDTMIIASRKLETLTALDPAARCAWTQTTMFFVTRNSRRTELRHTTAWKRTRDAFEHETIRAHFDIPADDHSDHLAKALSVLSALDRQLLIGQSWDGLSTAELAELHGLTQDATRQRIHRARVQARQSIKPT